MLCNRVEVVTLVDVFPFNHEVAHERVQDAALRGEIHTQVERLEVDARLEVIGFGSEVVRCRCAEIFILRVDTGIFTVNTEGRDNVIACVGGYPVSCVGRILNRVAMVGAVADLDFEREGELHVFFDTDVALVCVGVLRSEHDVEGAETVNPAQFNSVVAVIAHPETAFGEVLVQVSTEVGGLRPVSLPAAHFQVQLVLISEIPLVVGPVEVGKNLVVVLALDLVAEFRSEDTEHDKSVEVIALVLPAHVGADPAAAEVVLVVGDRLGELGLDVALEVETVIGSENGAGHARNQEHACDSGELHGSLLF